MSRSFLREQSTEIDDEHQTRAGTLKLISSLLKRFKRVGADDDEDDTAEDSSEQETMTSISVRVYGATAAGSASSDKLSPLEDSLLSAHLSSRQDRAVLSGAGRKRCQRVIASHLPTAVAVGCVVKAHASHLRSVSTPSSSSGGEPKLYKIRGILELTLPRRSLSHVPAAAGKRADNILMLASPCVSSSRIMNVPLPDGFPVLSPFNNQPWDPSLHQISLETITCNPEPTLVFSISRVCDVVNVQHCCDTLQCPVGSNIPSVHRIDRRNTSIAFPEHIQCRAQEVYYVNPFRCVH